MRILTCALAAAAAAARNPDSDGSMPAMSAIPTVEPSSSVSTGTQFFDEDASARARALTAFGCVADSCFEFSCDHWSNSEGYTCATLENCHSCDCAGCACPLISKRGANPATFPHIAVVRPDKLQVG